MTTVAVLGANVRAGRPIVAEAVRQGLAVTAVVRDSAGYQGPRGNQITVVRGDATVADDVRRATSTTDAVISAVSPTASPETYFPAVAAMLSKALPQETRLVVVGIGTTLEVAPGVALWQTPDFPREGIGFSTGHSDELAVLKATTGLDCLVVAPPPVLLDGQGYADLAAAVVRDVVSPQHHRMLLAVTS